jgi:SAM-dependent methyltransferase
MQRVTEEGLMEAVGAVVGGDEAFLATLTGPDPGAGAVGQRVTVRPVVVHGARHVQLAFRRGEREFHENVALADAPARVCGLLSGYRHVRIRSSDGDRQYTRLGDGGYRLTGGGPAAPLPALEHDRAKRRVIPENEPCEFLHALGVMTAEGRVVAARIGKFRQINRFLEIVADVEGFLPKTGPLHVVDLACGRAHLTFAVRHYLAEIAGRQVDVLGVDRKTEQVERGNRIAADLGLHGIRFEARDIGECEAPHGADLVLSLHACDTATDDALRKAVEWQAGVVLAAPCCQHALAPHLNAEGMEAVLKHGLFRERLSALMTDALRAAWLEACGYRVQALEFVDPEHTPKNLLLRAIRRPGGKPRPDAAGTYEALARRWGVWGKCEPLP